MTEKETIDRKAFLALQAPILLLEQKVEELEKYVWGRTGLTEVNNA